MYVLFSMRLYLVSRKSGRRSQRLALTEETGQRRCQSSRTPSPGSVPLHSSRPPHADARDIAFSGHCTGATRYAQARFSSLAVHLHLCSSHTGTLTCLRLRTGHNTLSHQIYTNIPLLHAKHFPLPERVRASCRLAQSFEQRGEFTKAMKTLDDLEQSLEQPGTLKSKQRAMGWRMAICMKRELRR